MRLQATKLYRPNELSEAALAASRQVWLASLGAAVVSRDWIQAEAGSTFRSLVKEGTAVESRAIRYLGDQLGTSMSRANTLWRETRSSLTHTVKNAADSAVSFVRETLPRSLPKLELAAAKPERKQAPARARKSTAKAATAKRATARKSAKRRTAR
jgi:hypothetical protein